MKLNAEAFDELYALVGRAEEFQPDPYIFLGNVKLHLCNRVMDAGDVQAWYICERAQRSVSGTQGLDLCLQSQSGCFREDA